MFRRRNKVKLIIRKVGNCKQNKGKKVQQKLNNSEP